MSEPAPIPEVWNGGDFPLAPVHTGRRTPIILRSFFVELSRQFYVDPAMQLSPLIKTWSAPNDKSHLWIDVTGRWVDGNVSRRPALLVDVGDLQFSPGGVQGIDNRMGSNLARGEVYQARVATGSVVFAHLALNDAESVLYATNTLDFLDAYAYVIRTDFKFERFQARGIFKPSMRKDQPREWECRVQVDFQFQETCQLKLEAPQLKQITLDTGFPAQQFNMT